MSTRQTQACRRPGTCWLLLALVFLAGPARADQPRFYLSTERIFSPGDKRVTVRMESRGLDHVDFRLYRIPAARDFFLGQKDLHRVETQNGPTRASSLDVLAEIWRLGLQNAVELAREGVSSASRAAAREAYPEDVEGAIQKSEEVPAPSTAIPLLKDFPLVDMWREWIESPDGEWSYLDVAVNTFAPGVYLLEGVYGHEVGYTVVIVSKLAVLTRQSGQRLLVYAVDPALGTPVPDAQVELYTAGKLMAKGETDSEGVWCKDIPLTREMVVFASKGASFAILDPTYHPANLFTRKVYLSTERPVYRPGQDVFFKGIVRAYRDERYRIDETVRQVELSAQDPNGHEVFSAKLPIKESGAFDGRFPLAEGASLGTYRLVARLDGKDYGGEFKVKEYTKPEYKVRIQTPGSACISGEKVSATVLANYYFGPPVPDAKVKVSVYRTRFYVPWWVDADYAWYYSDAEYRNTMRETIVEKEGRLDAQGRFAFDFDTRADSLDYTYGIEAVVTDASEQAVSGHARIQVTRARFRLSLEPEHLLQSPGSEARIRVRSTDFDRRPVPADVQVTVRARQGGDPDKAAEVELLSKPIRTGPKGEGWLEFTPPKSGTYTIEARAEDAKANTVDARARLFVTSQGGDIPYVPEEMEIIADRRSYSVGDSARFLLLTPHADSHLLVTVEGGNLYRHAVVKARGFSAVYELEIEPEQTPNFFLRAATIFEGSLFERRLDIVVPPREKLLDVSVRTDKPEARPGEQVRFEVLVRDHAGRPVENAEVALAVVDEAIYGLSPEIAVPISRFFYHRKRNNVRPTSSLDFRFYGYGQDSKDRMAALEYREPVVPGSFKALAAVEVRKHFKDTLSFEPYLKTDGDGVARCTLSVPDNLTAWRGTARAITAETQVGQGTGSLRVSKPVLVRLAAPAFLVEKDACTLAVMVHNYSDQAQRLQVLLESGGGEIVLEGKPMSLEVKPGAMASALWTGRAAGAGTAVLRARAEGSRFSDALEHRLPVLPYGMEQVLLAGGSLDDGSSQAKVELSVPASAAEGSTRAELSVSTGVAPAVFAAVRYLNDYPYHCTEQTMSRFLPDLLVAKALGEEGLTHRRLDEELPRQIHAGLARLAALQHSDGGWGWWFDDPTHPFMTAYVVHGLAMAGRLGWKVDEEMLARGVKRLKRFTSDRRLNPTERSYLLYSLALVGEKYESMLQKLAAQGELTEYGKAVLAMALLEMGKRESAAKLAGQIEMAVHTDPRGAWWGDDSRSGWEVDPVETTAAVLRALLAAQPDSVNLPGAVRWLMAVQERGHWRSTQDTSMAVFALVDYLKKFGQREYAAKVTTSLNGKAFEPRSLGKADIFKPSVALLHGVPARAGTNTFELSREGKGLLFYHAAVSYFGREDPIREQGSKFRIQRSLKMITRQVAGDGWKLGLAPLGARVQPGDLLLVQLDLQASEPADFIMIEAPIPAGSQPVERDRGYALPGIRLQQPGMHREFHDTHAAFFLSHLDRGSRRLAFLVRASLPGDYHVLPARVMPMYDPQFAGNSASHLVRVKEGS
ncbi:MAG: hypothetical protein JXR96_23320 [Deltaproteobacteria bacterium]|nr:hypothetical protein [Deltaproteobacteria bacterium]